ncbi:hypothetical protein PENTCL1PPCAC_2942, partial [Pristionchus entomophagus]
MKITPQLVTCTTKLWVDTGNASLQHWLSVDQLGCIEGSWKWKDNSGTEWNPIGKKEISCSAVVLPQATTLLYGTIWGSIGLLLIVLAVPRNWTLSLSMSPTQIPTVRSEKERTEASSR